jgi:Fe-S-cluster containining protein
VLLLPADANRLEEAGEREFMVEVKGKEPFVAEMGKAGGACIYLTREGCRVYHHCALICRMYPFSVEREEESESETHAAPASATEEVKRGILP